MFRHCDSNQRSLKVLPEDKDCGTIFALALFIPQQSRRFDLKGTTSGNGRGDESDERHRECDAHDDERIGGIRLVDNAGEQPARGNAKSEARNRADG